MYRLEDDTLWCDLQRSTSDAKERMGFSNIVSMNGQYLVDQLQVG
jgi:hypothetical protein